MILACWGTPRIFCWRCLVRSLKYKLYRFRSGTIHFYTVLALIISLFSRLRLFLYCSRAYCIAVFTFTFTFILFLRLLYRSFYVSVHFYALFILLVLLIMLAFLSALFLNLLCCCFHICVSSYTLLAFDMLLLLY